MTVPPSRTHDGVTVGQTLPELSIPLTRSSIVATALASRDYQDVHHDPDLARRRGSEDIFMNILTSNGLIERFVTEWAGPTAVVKAVKIRLGAPNHPGDTMVLTGEVSAKDDKKRRVEIAVRGTNSRGAHAWGTVAVCLPEEAAP